MNHSNKGWLLGCGLAFVTTSVMAQDWPQWRGPNRDNKVVGFKAPASWPKALTQKWKTPVGQGDSSPVLVGDKIYVFGRLGPDEIIQCLDAVSGKVLWDDKYASKPVAGAAGGIHAGPRATPVVADSKICTFGAMGTLSCVDIVTGKMVWRKETKGWPQFNTAASPLIVEKMCIAYTGDKNKGELAAYDLATGETKWTWTGEGPGYGSPVIMTVDGTKQIVTLTDKSVVGIGAVDGKLLWQVQIPGKGPLAMSSSTPIVDGSTVIVFKEGTMALQIEKKDGAFTTKELWKAKQTAGRFNTPVLKDGLLYGLQGGKGSTIYCMNAQNGEMLWTDSKTRGECGAILDAGSVLLVLTSDKDLVAFSPSKKEFTELAKFTVAETATWAYPVIAGNRIYVKDQNSLTLWTIE